MSETVPVPADRPLPGSFSAGLLVARLFFRVTLGRRRTLWMALLALAPLLVALYGRLFYDGSGMDWFTNVGVGLFLQFFALGMPLYLGVSAVWDEIDDKTIVYLFARPIHRAVILGGKVLSVMTVLSIGIGLDAALFYVVSVSRDGLTALGQGLPSLLTTVAVLALAVFAYTALFTLVGVLLRKPMVVAVMIGFGWEVVVSNFPSGFPRATLMFYLKSLLGIAPEGGSLMAMLLPPLSPAPQLQALLVVILAAAVFLGAALALGSNKEYRI